AADGPQKQSLSIVDGSAGYRLIHRGREHWAYDSRTNTAYHSTGPREARHGAERPPTTMPSDAMPQDVARQALRVVDDTTSVTVDGTANVAGRDAYQLLIRPKQAGSTVGSIRIAVDA